MEPAHASTQPGEGAGHRVRTVARWTALALAASLRAPAPLAAQAAAPVPPDDFAYELLARVHAQLPPTAVAHGQRPYTRVAFARLTREARVALDSATAGASLPLARVSFLDALVSALERRFADETALLDGRDTASVAPTAAAVDAVRLGVTAADSPYRGFGFNGLGRIDDATVNPLLDGRLGREAADGTSVALEADLRLRAGSRVALRARPRAVRHAPRHGADDADLLLAEALARGRLGGWALQVGRASLRRGQGRRSGLVLSDNAPPLDMVLVESEEAFRLPWIFGALGPTTFSAFLADLGSGQNFPGAQLYGNWLSVRPSRRLEVGGGFVVQSGGEGSPPQSFWERVGDYLIFVDVLFQGGSDFIASNKIAGLDFRLRLPEAGVAVYGEWYMDDFRVASGPGVRETLWADAAHVLGVELPRLDGTGRLSGWVEYHHTGRRMYRHMDFSSGVTRGRFLLGDPLGPDAHGILGGLDLLSGPTGAVSVGLAWERRSEDRWTAAEGSDFRFEKAEDGPEEERWRGRLSWRKAAPGAALGWHVEAGAEGVRNFGFEEGRSRTNAMAGVTVEWTPGR